jgi:hypothetical protein
VQAVSKRKITHDERPNAAQRLAGPGRIDDSPECCDGPERVFYDVTADEVQVLAIVAKENAQEWLHRAGDSS